MVHFGFGEKGKLNQIREDMAKFNLSDNFSYLGTVPNLRIHEFYSTNKVDFIFNLSTAEGIPVSLMEAASYGIPMIATKTVGNPEIVNNKNGI